MVEVFKTDVRHADHAKMLIDQIQIVYGDYIANFDLEDCDRILRVKCTTADDIHSSGVIALLNSFGFNAQVLPDDSPGYAIELTSSVSST